MRKTLVITGPGGVGKSPLDALFRDEVIRLDPYRLRPGGPRGSGDKLYAPPGLHAALKGVLAELDDPLLSIPDKRESIEWFPKSKVLFFTVRGVWQCLFLGNVESTNTELAKAEIYTPVLVRLLDCCGNFAEILGVIKIIVLNPAKTSLTKMAEPWKEIKEATRQNCERRGDKSDSIENRVKSIDVEAPVWQSLVGKPQVTEYVGWPFAEYCYPMEERHKAAKASLLIQARKHLLDGAPTLDEFFKSEKEILNGI